jgi:hypothetical protein
VAAHDRQKLEELAERADYCRRRGWGRAEIPVASGNNGSRKLGNYRDGRRFSRLPNRPMAANVLSRSLG